MSNQINNIFLIVYFAVASIAFLNRKKILISINEWSKEDEEQIQEQTFLPWLICLFWGPVLIAIIFEIIAEYFNNKSKGSSSK